MAKSYTNLIYHIVFSTKDRRPLITNELKPRLYEYIGGRQYAELAAFRWR